MKCPRKLPLAFHANCLASEKNVKNIYFKISSDKNITQHVQRKK